MPIHRIVIVTEYDTREMAGAHGNIAEEHIPPGTSRLRAFSYPSVLSDLKETTAAQMVI